MTILASTTVMIGVALMLPFFALLYASAWLRGPGWFWATILTLASSLVAFSADMLRSESGLSFWILLAFVLLFICIFFYFIAGRYITQTKLLDLTYQSQSALVQYIKDHEIESPLASLLRWLGPALFVAMLLLACLGFWAKSRGAIG